MAEVRQRWRKVICNTGLMGKKQSNDCVVLCPAYFNGQSAVTDNAVTLG